MVDTMRACPTQKCARHMFLGNECTLSYGVETQNQLPSKYKRLMKGMEFALKVGWMTVV